MRNDPVIRNYCTLREVSDNREIHAILCQKSRIPLRFTAVKLRTQRLVYILRRVRGIQKICPKTLDPADKPRGVGLNLLHIAEKSIQLYSNVPRRVRWIQKICPKTLDPADKPWGVGTDGIETGIVRAIE